MIIDFHCHIFNESLSLDAFRAFYKKFEGYGFYERIAEMLDGRKRIETKDIIEKTLFYLNRSGVEKVVLLPVNSKENLSVKKWHQRAPHRFIPFYNPPETNEHSNDIETSVESAVREEGYKGFKIMVSFRKKKLNDKILFPTLEIAQKYKLPVLFHSGYPPPGTPRNVLTFSNPIVLDEFVNSFPKTNVIIAHMGYPWVDNALALAVQYSNIYLDVSNLTYMMPNRLREFILNAKELIGVNKILFGSDGFVPEMIEVAVNYFKRSDFLTREDLQKILADNAIKLLFKSIKS